jgi:hypothetical protein
MYIFACIIGPFSDLSRMAGIATSLGSKFGFLPRPPGLGAWGRRRGLPMGKLRMATLLSTIRGVFVVSTVASLAGCASTPNAMSKAIVSVSAVNYSEVAPSGNVLGVVNGTANLSPDIPTIPKPTRPVFYLMVPGEIYSSDVPIDAIYHQLRVSLEHRGYYNALTTLVKAARPLQVDYLLRLHYGVRPWSNPTVRFDQVTWGNDGLVAKRYQMRTLLNNSQFDPRTGLDQDEVRALRTLGLRLMADTGSGKSDLSNGTNAVDIRDFVDSAGAGPKPSAMTPPAHDFCLVVLEAFKFSDVKAMDRKAPCIWMIFIAVPIDSGEKLSSLLPTMLKTAEPYYGGTTQGLQVFEVPTGKVEVGNPVEIKDNAAAPDPRLAPSIRWSPPQ